MANDILLKASGIEKSFGLNRVLLGADLEIRRGEVMALLGENGAGKSTLMKIVTGVYQRDGGTLTFDGVDFPQVFTKEFAEKQGISIIYQELSDIPTLTVAQNIFLGHEPMNHGLIDYKKLNTEAQAAIDLYKFDLKATDRMSDLSIAKKQLVEILKALVQNCKMLIMDEPTASLSEKEVGLLFDIVRDLKERGIAILYISHRLKEITQIADRVTILRDGVVVASGKTSEISPEQIIDYMIGKRLTEENYDEKVLHRIEGNPILEVKNLTSPGKFQNISFTLTEGEILGIGGLVGAGRTELARVIFGADPYESGEIYLSGESYHPSLKNSIRRGIAYVPEDRRLQGILPQLDISKNLSITNFHQVKDPFGVSRAKEIQLSKKMIEMLNINPPDHNYILSNMSGGNQQKVVLGKWLARELKILIADEPTAGVDIGAKAEIYDILRNLCKKGVSIILISSDLPELVRLSDRIIVLHKGEVFKEFSDGSICEADILMASSGYRAEEGVAQ